MTFTMDTPMVFPILWVLPCISATVGTMGFAMYTPMGFYVYLEALFLSQKLHSKILCFSSLCSTKILSSFVSNWHLSQVNPPTSSVRSRLLSWSPDDDDDYEGGFNQDDADDDIDDDVYDDVDDGVKAHDVSYLLQPPCLWSREFPCQLLSSQGQ